MFEVSETLKGIQAYREQSFDFTQEQQSLGKSKGVFVSSDGCRYDIVEDASSVS